MNVLLVLALLAGIATAVCPTNVRTATSVSAHPSPLWGTHQLLSSPQAKQLQSHLDTATPGTIIQLGEGVPSTPCTQHNTTLYNRELSRYVQHQEQERTAELPHHLEGQWRREHNRGILLPLTRAALIPVLVLSCLPTSLLRNRLLVSPTNATQSSHFVMHNIWLGGGIAHCCALRTFSLSHATCHTPRTQGEKLSVCLTVENCKHIEISQLALRSCDTGVAIAKSSAVTVDTLWVQSVQKQGVHIKDGSVGCQVSHCRISNTGMTYSEWGFGVQIGRPKYDFGDGGADGEETVTNTLDRCRNNKVIGNKIGPDVKGAGIVIYEGSTGLRASTHPDTVCIRSHFCL